MRLEPVRFCTGDADRPVFSLSYTMMITDQACLRTKRSYAAMRQQSFGSGGLKQTRHDGLIRTRESEVRRAVTGLQHAV